MSPIELFDVSVLIILKRVADLNLMVVTVNENVLIRVLGKFHFFIIAHDDLNVPCRINEIARDRIDNTVKITVVGDQ